jgi:hypothetical protein
VIFTVSINFASTVCEVGFWYVWHAFVLELPSLRHNRDSDFRDQQTYDALSADDTNETIRLPLVLLDAGQI